MTDTLVTPDTTSASTDITAPIDSPTASPNEVAASTATTGQASLGQRAGAFCIDMGVMIGLVVIISLTIGMISPKLGTLLSLAGMAYMITRDCLPFLGGQSVGKKMLGLRAVATDGSNLSGNWSPGLTRNVVLLIPFFLIVELIILFTKQTAPEGLLRLGDQWAGTKVIIDQ